MRGFEKLEGGMWDEGRWNRWKDLPSHLRPLGRETAAQSTLEYAIVLFAFLAVITGIAALWRAGEDGVFVGLVEDAASHAFDGTGALDISLY